MWPFARISSMNACSSSCGRPTSLQPTWVTPESADRGVHLAGVLQGDVVPGEHEDELAHRPLLPKLSDILGILDPRASERRSTHTHPTEDACAPQSGKALVGWRWAPCPTPTCPADGVLLKVLACGICGTDVRSFYNGDRRIEPPWVLGHEISGEVDRDRRARRSGDGRQRGISLGDAVHCISTLWCGRCRMCLGGHEHLCVLGELMGFNYQGAYAELVAIPEIALKNLFRIPDGLSPAHATFADPLSDVICGHKDIAIGLDDTVVVIGAGPVGAAHAALARAAGRRPGAALRAQREPARARRGDPRPRAHGVRRHRERRTCRPR